MYASWRFGHWMLYRNNLVQKDVQIRTAHCFLSVEMPWLSFENCQRIGVVGLSLGRHRERERAHPRTSRATFIAIELLKARAYA